MPVEVSILQVFAASPGDVSGERVALERVVQKLNLTVAPMLGVRLELIRWETHAYPDFGADAQDVINRQLPSDFDIFVGILWGRFGTPTGRADSGTEEEFDRALVRYRAGEPVRLMVYFKDAPLSPSQLDPAQLSRVLDFKKRIQTEGGLHWTFVDQFEELFELHLMRHLQEFQKTRGFPHVGSQSSSQRTKDVQMGEQDEEGLLDFMEAYNEHFARLIEVQQRITEAIEQLGERMSERAAEVTRANEEGRRGDLPYIRRLSSKTAEDMQQFVARMDVDIPIFATEFEAGFRAFMNGVATSGDFEDPNDANNLREMLDTLTTTNANLDATRESVTGLRNSTASLPRLTTSLNRAKRATVAVLDRLIHEFDTAETLLREVRGVLESRLREIDAG